MASKGPTSGKPVPAAVKSRKIVKAPVKSKTSAAVPEAVAAPVVEKKKPVPKAPVAVETAPAPAEPASAVVAEAHREVPSITDSNPVAPIETAAPVKAAENVAEEIVAPIAKVAEAAAEVIEAAVETPAPPAVEPAPVPTKEFRMTVTSKTLFTDFNDRAKGAMEKSAKTVEELNDFAKGNVEAFVESSKITAKGLEALGQDAAEYGRKSFETATAALKGMAAAKSPTDFFKLQSDFFRGAFDSYIAEASKTTEAVIKLAGEAAQPISSRVALAAEKAKIAA